MQFRRQPREAMQINLTPLIDVVFLLLIFFMVSTSFNREAQLSVDLPSASHASIVDKPAIIDVGISRDGQVFVAGSGLNNLNLDVLQGALRQAAAGQAQPSIVVSADAQAPHQSLVSVMNAAASLGYNKLALAAQREE